MNNSTGYYSVNHQPPRAATFAIRKNNLAINLQDEDGSTKTVYWYYDLIMKEKSVANTFKYAEFPPQYIQVHSQEVAAEIEKRIEKMKRSFVSRQSSILVKVAAAFLLIILVIYFFLLPWAAGALAARFPVSYEKSLGDAMYNGMKGDFVIDEKKTAYVNEFFRELHFSTNYAIKITVVKSDIANAFAVPGGHIVVYDKILNGMTSYSELAALLSHETTHVENRHSLRSLFRQLGASVLLSMITGDAQAAGTVLLSQADNLKSLSYSRSLEKEADETGLQLLAKRGIGCAGFIRLFQLLKKEVPAKVSEWVSSHPDLDKRIKNIQKQHLCKEIRVADHPTLQTLFSKIKSAE